MVLHKLVRRNYGGKSPVSIKYQNLHSFKKGMILLSQSILQTRWISHLHGSALFTIPLITIKSPYISVFSQPCMDQEILPPSNMRDLENFKKMQIRGMERFSIGGKQRGNCNGVLQPFLVGCCTPFACHFGVGFYKWFPRISIFS